MTAAASASPVADRAEDAEAVTAPDVDPDAAGTAGITLSAEEAPLVEAEATAAANVLPEPLASAARSLAEAAPGGAVPAELVEALEYVLTTSLAGGRARRRYRAEGEKLLNRVLARTPAGRTTSNAVDELNRALVALAGRPIDAVRVATRIPGSHTVRIEADGLAFTLGFSGAGVTLESVAT